LFVVTALAVKTLKRLRRTRQSVAEPAFPYWAGCQIHSRCLDQPIAVLFKNNCSSFAKQLQSFSKQLQFFAQLIPVLFKKNIGSLANQYQFFLKRI
jgi:hypothetical protein